MSKLTDNIIELNRDMEQYIIQGSATRPYPFKDRFKPLQFVHLSDAHAVLELWDRMVEYVNHYKEYIDFAIHTGDYCGNNQELYSDFYNYGTPCARPIYNCIGNHDQIVTRKWLQATKESAYKLLFAPINDDSMDVNFLECEYSMTYYKDFPESNVRLIVLDLYFDLELQSEWLKKILAEAKENGLCVITAMHEPSSYVNDTYGVTFHTKNDYLSICGKDRTQEFEAVIAEFIAQGGCHICNIAGHVHHDLFGLTDAGVLNTTVPCATDWNGWTDGKRVRGTRTYDCFNVVSIDANLGILKIARIGNNIDNFFRSQRSLCFDYINRKVIYND